MSTKRFREFLKFAPHSIDFDLLAKVPVNVILNIVDAIDEAVFQGSLGSPDCSVEKFLIRPSQPGASTGLDVLNEDLVDLGAHLPDDGHVLLLGGRQRVHQSLALPCRDQSPLHPDLADELGEADPAVDDSKGAEDGTLAGVDVVPGTGQPVAPTGRHVLHKDRDGDLLLPGLELQVGGHQVGLDRRPSWGVDCYQYLGQSLRLEGVLDLLPSPLQAQAVLA